jgi:hypothetical protein
MSTSSANSIYVEVDGLIVRQAEHSCACEECKHLDENDRESLRLCHEFLDGKLDFNTWWDEFTGNAINFKHTWSAYFDSGPIRLSDAVNSVVYEQQDRCDGKPFSVEEIKMTLWGMIYGYEIRQRTVHLWKVTNRPKPEVQP